jgi:hypothetical protein
LKDWEKYYNIWKGTWAADQKTRDAERSRIIAPATQQAVDSMVAEMSEATFGKGMWFDIEDNDDPQQFQAAQQSRANLLEDFDRDAVPASVRESYMLGAIYGTGIAKRIVSELPDGGVSVGWEPIPPYNFVIDTAAKNIKDALGCAHETIRPIHEIEEKQRSGEYIRVSIGPVSGTTVPVSGSSPNSTDLEVEPSDGIYITEYHGLVPEKYFMEEAEVAPYMEGLEKNRAEDGAPEPEGMVEAIITIGNSSILLKKVINPFNDRGVIAYQHDIVPNRFWGRGICEKTFNSQSALDAEIRARIDALGLMTYPVMGADATRLPRNLNLKIQPGKTFLTNGRPSEVLEPITFGNLDPVSFQQSGDMERFVQMAAGSYDPATPIGVNARNETASGASMGMGNMVKRAKMTMFNVDQNFLDPLVKKSLLVYRELDQQRYPIDTTFIVNSSMSIMAKEFEQTQMTNLLAIIPPESPVYMMVLKTIIENYSGPSKDKLVMTLDEMMQPDPQKQQMEQALQMVSFQTAQAELVKVQREGQKLESEIMLNQAKTKKELVMAKLEDEKVDLDAARIVIEERQTRVQEKQIQVKEKEVNQKAKEPKSASD